MLAHRLTDKITIQKKTQVKNESTGSLSDSWVDLITVSAEAKYISGSEMINRGILNSYIIDFIVRFRSEINLDCQVVWNNQKFNLTAIEPIGRKQTLRLKCQRI
jgi:SPP1 family predicted phage head-tail adaptor